MSAVLLTLFHHANVHTAFEPACLAVAPVVLGDGATAVKGTCEGGLTLHTAPKHTANIRKFIKTCIYKKISEHKTNLLI